MEDEDLTLAVKKGAAWLDENHPGWASLINLSKLRMDNCSYCIIGQAVGDYFNTCVKMNNLTNDPDWAMNHGFDLEPFIDRIGNWRTLEELWAVQVKDRITPNS